MKFVVNLREVELCLFISRPDNSLSFATILHPYHPVQKSLGNSKYIQDDFIKKECVAFC